MQATLLTKGNRTMTNIEVKTILRAGIVIALTTLGGPNRAEADDPHNVGKISNTWTKALHQGGLSNESEQRFNVGKISDVWTRALQQRSRSGSGKPQFDVGRISNNWTRALQKYIRNKER
jgi:hypothetical protein